MSNETNKPIVLKAQAILKEYGYDVKLGHLYEVFSKLSGETSWNVAKVKETSFQDQVLSKTKSPTLAEVDEELIDLKRLWAEVGLIYQNQINESGFDFKFGYNLETKEMLKVDFLKEPNAIFIGGLGSGKSVAMRASLANWLIANKGRGTMFVVDLLRRADDHTPLLCDNRVHGVYTAEDFHSTLEWLNKELDERERLFANTQVSNVVEYNTKSTEKIDPCILILEDLTDVIELTYDVKDIKNNGSTSFLLNRILEGGRAYGLWVIAATMRAAEKDIPLDVMNNFSNKLVFRIREEEVRHLGVDMSSRAIGIREKGMCHTKKGVTQFPFLTSQEIERLIKNSLSPLKATRSIGKFVKFLFNKKQ